MNGFVLLCLGFIATACAQDWSRRSGTSLCPRGFDYDRNGRPETCGGFVGEQCPPTSYCRYLPRSDYGYCCRRSSNQLQCASGMDPHPTASCGGFLNPRCPFGYTCVTNPLIPESRGICCPSTDQSQLQCASGLPLPGIRCGGFGPGLNQYCPDPRRYECVTNPLLPDGQGICCPRNGLNPPTRY